MAFGLVASLYCFSTSGRQLDTAGAATTRDSHSKKNPGCSTRRLPCLQKLLQAIGVAGGPRIKVQALVLAALVPRDLCTRVGSYQPGI